jgi:outer membrane immunogenic protein
MKKLLVAGIAVAAFCAAPALAADMPVKGPVYKAAPAAFSWSGCYIGAAAGYGWGSTNHTFTDGFPALRGTDVNGGIIGGTLGCNAQTGNWVWGIENDFSWTGFKGSDPDIQNPAFFTIGTKVRWLDTLRGRVGVANGPSLWYVTGGAAFADIVDFEHSAAVSQDVSKTRSGWTVGAGVEWAMSDPHWSWKLEYLYVDFGNKLYPYTVVGPASERANLTENIVRIGINWRGDWGKGPVSAKY